MIRKSFAGFVHLILFCRSDQNDILELVNLYKEIFPAEPPNIAS